MRIEKADKLGFCLGVRRAVTRLEKVAVERGGVETLGAVVHNQQVLERLAGMGVRTVREVADIQGDIVVTSTHGVSPQVEEMIRARHVDIISTTCPFVRRAQVAARRLAECGFFVIVFGDSAHPEVRGILGWAGDKGVALPDSQSIAALRPVPRRVGVLSQTTQVPAHFNDFAKSLVDSALAQDSEIRIIDTICHDIRQRQAAALELARRVDLMLVIGGRTSANTRHLVELCAEAARTYQVETGDDIQPSWLKGRNSIGVTAGASTADWTIDEVMARLEAMARRK